MIRKTYFKKIFAAVLTSLSISLFAEVPEEIGDFDTSFQDENFEETLIDDDIGSLFDDAEDTQVEDSAKTIEQVGYTPFSISGSFSSNIGARVAYDYEKNESSTSLLFDFNNSTSMFARIDETLGFRATFNMGFSDWSRTASAQTTASTPTTTDLSGATPSFKFEPTEFYFDYLMFDRIYLTAGRKAFSWGYPRILGGTNILAMAPYANKKKLDATETGTDIYDSKALPAAAYAGLLRIPFPRATISVIGLYNASENSELFSQKLALARMSVAGSIEVMAGPISINMFGRLMEDTIDESRDGNLEEANRDIFTGIEFKSSIFSIDFYGQYIADCAPYFKEIKDQTITGGFFYYKEQEKMTVGVNYEIQDKYNLVKGTNNLVMTLQLGFKGFDKSKTLSAGVNGTYNVFKKSGNIDLDLVKTGLFPHAKWHNVLSASYDTKWNMSFTSLINIGMDF